MKTEGCKEYVRIYLRKWKKPSARTCPCSLTKTENRSRKNPHLIAATKNHKKNNKMPYSKISDIIFNKSQINFWIFMYNRLQVKIYVHLFTEQIYHRWKLDIKIIGSRNPAVRHQDYKIAKSDSQTSGL